MRLRPVPARTRYRDWRLPLIFLTLLSTLAAAGALASRAGAQSQSESDLNTPLTAPGGPPGLLDVQPIAQPMPLDVQGKAYLVYELLVTNFQTAPVALESLRADGGPMGIFNFADGALKSMVDLPARYGATGQELSIEPLKTRLLMLWLPFASRQVPHRLMHTIGYSVASGSGSQAGRRPMTVVTQPPLLVDYKARPVVIGPPLRGNDWLAGNGPSNTSSHRRAFMVADGQIYFPEWFAIDFVQLGKDGKTYTGDPRDNRSYHAYGADVIAVAEGRVVDARSGIHDNVPGSVAGPITMATIARDYVIEEIGNGVYAFYAHLKPGSIKVWVGAGVKRGQVLGSLGNTGNSTEPHLHFHVISRPSPLAGNGLPYAFDHFSIVPSHPKESAQEIAVVFDGGEPLRVSDSLVLENAVIDFPSH
jgi:peptidase M23-like protein